MAEKKKGGRKPGSVPAGSKGAAGAAAEVPAPPATPSAPKKGKEVLKRIKGVIDLPWALIREAYKVRPVETGSAIGIVGIGAAALIIATLFKGVDVTSFRNGGFAILAMLGLMVVTLLVVKASTMGGIPIKYAAIGFVYLVLGTLITVVFLSFYKLVKADGSDGRYFATVKQLYADAAAARDKQDYDGAQAKLSEIFQVSDQDLPFRLSDVVKMKAEMAYRRKLWDQAAQSYGLYLQLKPDDFDALVAAGETNRKLEDYERATWFYRQAQAKRPDDRTVLNGLQNSLRRLGGFYAGVGRTDTAEQLYQESRTYIVNLIKITEKAGGPNHVIAHASLAKLEWQRGNYSAAVAKYREVIATFAESQAAREDLAATLLEWGQNGGGATRVDEAAKLYGDLYKAPPPGADKVFLGAGWGEALAESETASATDLAAAEEAADLAIANNLKASVDPYALYAAARIKWKLGRKPEARKLLAMAIDAERRRTANPYTFDFERLEQYRTLQKQWKE